MTDPRFVVVDLELTNREPAQAHIVEWAAVVIEPEWFGQGGQQHTAHGLVRPPVPIPPETSAVHHITDADVATASTWEKESMMVRAILEGDETIVVGHTVDTERAMLASLNLTCRWLCTYKAALRVWPDAPAHSNEALRYYLGFGTGRKQPQATHSAAHDAEVTAQILRELLKLAKLDEMLNWTEEPALLPRCPIGDYRGDKWADVPESFLNWILHKAHSMRPDVRFCAQKEIERRDEEYRLAQAATGVATSIVDEDEIPF